MNHYSNEEYVDMIISYGAAQQNAALARRIYQQRFPNRIIPSVNTFLRVIQRGRETGNLQPKKGRGGGRPNEYAVNVEEEILERVDVEATTSTRQISRQVVASQSFVWRTLKRNGLHPYHLQRVQGLIPADYPSRQQFCEWFLNRINEENHFATNVLVTDECCFSREGVLNFHNAHVWADENPHSIRQNNFQQKFRLNLWAGILNNNLIGPFELPTRLNGESYLHFLREVLPELLEDIPLDIRRKMWFMHDGCPAHFSRSVRNFLNETYPQRWIGRGSIVQWPPRSPDLNPVDFFLWGYMKERIYATEVETIGELRNRVNTVAEHLRQQFPPLTQNWIRRAQLCVEREGGHFEHVL